MRCASGTFCQSVNDNTKTCAACATICGTCSAVGCITCSDNFVMQFGKCTGEKEAVYRTAVIVVGVILGLFILLIVAAAIFWIVKQKSGNTKTPRSLSGKK